MTTVLLYTDGGCSPNPGLGSWAWYAAYSDGSFEKWAGMLPHTTNQMAELNAIQEGLLSIQGPAEVQVFTDSQCAVRWFYGTYKRRKQHIKTMMNHIDNIIADQELEVEMYHVPGESVPQQAWCDATCKRLLGLQP